MKISVLKLVCVVLIYILSFDASSKQYTDIFTAELASEHVLEPSVKFIQDDKSQIWLLSKQSVSLFRDGKFISFKTFDFSSDVLSGGIIDDYLYVATETQIYHVSLLDSALPIHSVWQIKDNKIVDLVNYESSLLIQTNNNVYQLNKPGDDESTPSIKPFFELPAKFKKLLVIPQGVLILEVNQLDLYSTDEQTWLTANISSNLKEVVEYQGNLLYLTQKGNVQAANPFNFYTTKDVNSKRLKSFNSVSDLIPFNGDIYVKRRNQLYSIQSENYSFTLPKQVSDLFFDNNNNLWLVDSFGVQIAWSQPFTAEIFKPSTRNANKYIFDSISTSGTYALKSNRLYQQRMVNETLVWQYKVSFPHIKNVTQLIETKRHIWFVSPSHIWSYEKQTLLLSLDLSISKGDLVLPHTDNNLLIVQSDQVVSISAVGKQTKIQSKELCGATCLPEYKVSEYLLDGRIVWLATNRGLHQLDLATLKFTSKRLDILNTQAPVIQVLKATKQQVWVVYPTKVALLDKKALTSILFFTPNNKILNAVDSSDDKIELLSQKGWLRLSKSKELTDNESNRFWMQKYTHNSEALAFEPVVNEVELSDSEQELKLLFNLTKQHPSENVFVRFKYQDDTEWSNIDKLNQLLTLKNLRQGSNQLEVQARLEGKDWEPIQLFSYLLPYSALQPKWLIVYGIIFLVIAVIIFLYTRFSGINVAFNAVKQQAFISSLLESTKDGVWVANKDREIKSINGAFSEITGYELKDIINKSFPLMTEQGRNHEVETLIWQEVTKSGYWSGEVWSRQKNGEPVSFDLSVTRVESQNKSSSKKDVTFVGVFSDVTIRKKSEQDLRHLATRDSITQLPNRTLFIEYVNNAINTSNPLNPHFAVVFIDLDNFRKVNESLSHLQGDALIKQVGERLSNILDKGVALARLGGDEFALLIPNVLLSSEPRSYIKRVAENLKNALQTPFLLGETEVNITASLGVSISPENGQTAEVLMRCADTALSMVKRRGKNNYHIYRQKTDAAGTELLSLESELIGALDNDQFVVHYQPKYKLKEKQISGFEALIRWNNPTRGLVAPDQFIRLAEENGLIRKLDTWVFKQVCQQIKTWQEQGVMFGKVAVNVSALNFQQVDFCQNLKDILVKENLSAEYLELEITEAAMMTDLVKGLENLEDLRSAGFTIALDDFGSSNSSLSYIKKFPIDRLKIDRSFIMDIETSEQDKNITGVLVQLAEQLNISVIAEGVETTEQVNILLEMGCNEIQGFIISQAMMAEDVNDFLNVGINQLPEFG
jgi:diguanylate cyclase (GGDEF)-like protein/PAS domain S-box-containing protein